MINSDQFNDELGENHIATSAQNPVRNDAFTLSDEQKIELIKKDVENILHTLGMDLTDDSIKGTPNRVAKMFVKEIFGGLNPNKKPKASTFANNYKYGEMLVEKNITLYSTCEHHLLPIIGKAHVAYISNGTVVGLSKMNRIVDYYAKRPQVQERLTMQIVQELQQVLGTEDVACVIDAKHLCVNSRGIRDVESSTVTSEYGGKFPGTLEALQKLPGIGPYTAGAIAAIAFDKPFAAVDGNVERVISRLDAIETPLPDSKPQIKIRAQSLMADHRAGDFVQALMDLGATICTPKSPNCLICPRTDECEGRKLGIAATLPRKRKKQKIPTRKGHAYVAISNDGFILLRRREEKGLLGGMMEVPGSDWSETPIDTPPLVRACPQRIISQILTSAAPAAIVSVMGKVSI